MTGTNNQSSQEKVQSNKKLPEKPNQSPNGPLKDKLKKKAEENPSIALAGVVAALAVPTILYFGYDLVRSELSPCDSIFEQTSLNLTTKIRFLKTEGEVQLGRSQIADLNERAQMTAINMKTCCTVLDQGKLDPEQFLQCKEKTRAYDDRIGELVELVKATMVTAATPKSPAMSTAAAEPSANLVVDRKLNAEITKNVQAAKEVSMEFNQKVVQVRKEQALERLEVIPPKNVDIAGQEREPNNDILNTNVIELDKWVTASVGQAGDADFYFFTTPGTHRDWLKVEVQNRSTTLEPRIRIYNDKKADAGGTHSETQGADLSHSFVVAPESKFYVRISSYYGKSSGIYLLRVSPQKAYDKYEPNQDILKAGKASIGDELEASIMDRYDADYYKFENKGDKGKIVIKLENRSRTLRPKITLFNGKKVYLGRHHSETAGADVEYPFEMEAGKKYYFAIEDYYQGAAGDYTVTIERP